MTLKKKIEKMLAEKPHCRDNDNALCLEIWGMECRDIGYEIGQINAVHFLNLESEGAISKKQSILRARRNLNNKKPETIGKSYYSNLRAKKKKKVVNHPLSKVGVGKHNIDPLLLQYRDHQFPNIKQVEFDLNKQQEIDVPLLTPTG